MSGFFSIGVIILFAVICFISFGAVAYKRKMSFGAIVAGLGAILVIVGFAWLIAQNWHFFPSFLKIIILVGLTSLAYILGVVLKEKDYPTIAKALFIIGALLYTLSVFLIAQIFSTSINIQNYAWLLLICWLGVTFSSYLFNSYTTFTIALIQILIWIPLQFMALLSSTPHLKAVEYAINFPIIAIFVFLFLITGTLFYGLNLWHRTFQHKFSKLFQWWTIFYFLVFTYVLTFQYVIPKVWGAEDKISLLSSPMLFFFSLMIISLIVFFSGIFIALNKKTVSGKEILGALLIIILLIGVILLTKIPSNILGTCYTKNCYDFTDKTSCENAPQNLICVWGNQSYQIKESCYTPSCYELKDQLSCDSHYNDMGCKWRDSSQGDNSPSKLEVQPITTLATYSSKGDCLYEDCYSFTDRSSCENSPKILNCKWQNDGCSVDYQRQDSCSAYNNKKKECFTHEECGWRAGYSSYYGYGRSENKTPLILWFVWIVINIFFIILILAIIGYGTLEKSTRMINLGISFFSLDILTRYIGFVMDFWGYTSLALIFISGGIILILGGWLIIRWRKKLVAGTKQDVSQPQINIRKSRI